MAVSNLNISFGRDSNVLSDIGESEVSDSPWDGGLQPTKRPRRQPPRPATKKPGSPPPRKTYFDVIYQTKKVREECEGHLNKFRERVLATRPVAPLDIPIAKLKGLEEKMTRMCKVHGIEDSPSLDQSANGPTEGFHTRHRALLDKFHSMIERATALYNDKLDTHVAQYMGQLQQMERELKREREECKKDSGASEQLAALQEKGYQDEARIEDLERQLTHLRSSEEHKTAEIAKRDGVIRGYRSSEHRAEKDYNKLTGKKIAELEYDKQTLNTTVGQSKRELKETKHELEVALGSKKKYKAQYQECKAELDQTMIRLAESDREMSGLRTKVKEQLKELETVRQKLHEVETTVAAETEGLKEANETISSCKVVLEQRLDSFHILLNRQEEADTDYRQETAHLGNKDTSRDLSAKRSGTQESLQLCERQLAACQKQRMILADSLTVAEEFKQASDCKLESGRPAKLWMCKISDGSCIFFLKSEQDSLLVTCAPSQCAWSDANRLSVNIARPDGERMIITLFVDLDMDWFEACWLEKWGCVYVMDDIDSWRPDTGAPSLSEFI